MPLIYPLCFPGLKRISSCIQQVERNATSKLFSNKINGNCSRENSDRKNGTYNMAMISNKVMPITIGTSLFL